VLPIEHGDHRGAESEQDEEGAGEVSETALPAGREIDINFAQSCRKNPRHRNCEHRSPARDGQAAPRLGKSVEAGELRAKHARVDPAAGGMVAGEESGVDVRRAQRAYRLAIPDTSMKEKR
jgi:hypothetical protein